MGGFSYEVAKNQRRPCSYDFDPVSHISWIASDRGTGTGTQFATCSNFDCMGYFFGMIFGVMVRFYWAHGTILWFALREKEEVYNCTATFFHS